MYNLTNLTNSNTIVEMTTEVNTLSGGLFIVSIMLILFVAYLVIFKKQNFKPVLVAGSFFMTILSIMAFTFGWIGTEVLIVPIILLLASILIFYFVT